MKKIKSNETMVKLYTFTTTDGKTFSSNDKSEAKDKAEKHQQQLDKAAARDKISRDLWEAFGLNPSNYDDRMYVWDIDRDDPAAKDCKKLEDIFGEFGTTLWNGENDSMSCFGEFVGAIEDIFIDHYKECKTVMDIISKYMTTQE